MQIIWRAVVLATTTFLCVTAFQARRQTNGQKWLKDPNYPCASVSPVSLTVGRTYWVGECAVNKASGFGMLRRRDGDHAGRAFYGEMRVGVPAVGVIDNEGYRVGRFKDGDIGDDAELVFQVRMDAFEAAVRAAREVDADMPNREIRLPPACTRGSRNSLRSRSNNVASSHPAFVARSLVAHNLAGLFPGSKHPVKRSSPSGGGQSLYHPAERLRPFPWRSLA
ncbi:hypothetical protein [Rhizobium sp. P28RR-XV]|uniref:hypothetical protein n=1 Tax=Rhizobium sp. P28RR-XV TaxID=2726737 RepID=UPI001FEDFD54|nr:hypothetical protein [Rhizobium sp. P28RR-XV]